MASINKIEAIFISICAIIHFYHVYLQNRWDSEKFKELDFFGYHYIIFTVKFLQFRTNMNTLELKNNFHLLIDKIENENILSKFYMILSSANENEDGELWKNLSSEDKEELLLSYSESEDDQYLISYSEVKKRYEKWL